MRHDSLQDLTGWLRTLGAHHEARALVCHLLVGLREHFDASFAALAHDVPDGSSLSPLPSATLRADSRPVSRQSEFRAYFPLDPTPPAVSGATTVETSTVKYGTAGAPDFWDRHDDVLRLHQVDEQPLGTTPDGTTLVRLGSVEGSGSLLVGPRPDRQPRSPGEHEQLELVGLHVGSLIDRVRLRQALEHDPLTGVLSHRAIFSTLRTELSRAVTDDHPVTIGIIELDRLGEVHRTMGHPAGERLACEVCSALDGMLRPGDHLGRYGGQEFLLVLPNTPLHRASTLVRSICEQVRQLRVDVGTAQPLSTTLSVGLLALEYGGTNALAQSKLEDLVAVADFALLQAKQKGGDTIHKWSWRHTAPLASRH